MVRWITKSILIVDKIPDTIENDTQSKITKKKCYNSETNDN